MFGREKIEVFKADAPGEGMIDVMEAECADKVMDAMEDRIKELEIALDLIEASKEDKVKALEADINQYKRRIKELEETRPRWISAEDGFQLKSCLKDTKENIHYFKPESNYTEASKICTEIQNIAVIANERLQQVREAYESRIKELEEALEAK